MGQKTNPIGLRLGVIKGVEGRRQRRSKYGAKRPKQAAKK